MTDAERAELTAAMAALAAKFGGQNMIDVLTCAAEACADVTNETAAGRFTQTAQCLKFAVSHLQRAEAGSSPLIVALADGLEVLADAGEG